MANTEKKNTPRKVIDGIRSEYILDDNSANERVKKLVLNLQTELNSTLKLLSDDLYSKKSHFILELVQNADDNSYASGITPHLTLEVTPARLVVVNNEIGFNQENVEAICRSGASSKSKQKSGYIGEKGIGFKSVFTVSNAPEIHSNGFHFKFDRTIEGSLLGYVVPHWCEPPVDMKPDSTTIILPAAKSYQFGTDTLVDLDARLLLFLNKLRQLTLAHNDQVITYSREDKGGLSSLTTLCESSGDCPLEAMHYVRAEMTFPIGEHYIDEKRPGIEQSTVVLAFPVDEKGAAKPEPASHVFAYLPIRPMGFKFPIQADFILSSSREEILTDRPWSKMLRDGVAEVFLNALESFKKSEPLALSYLKYIPAEGDVVDPFFHSVRKLIIDKLADEKCLLSTSGDWKKPCELRIAKKKFQALFPSNTAKQLFGFDYVDSRIQGGNDILKGLGAEEVKEDDLLSIFRDHEPWLQKQPLQWRAKFYAFVADEQQGLIDAGLLDLPCLPIAGGSCVIPVHLNVFFPLGKGKKYGFESELVLVDIELYEKAQKHSKRVGDLFSAMKVRVDEPYDLVNAHILPRHKGDAWKTSDFKALVGHLRYIKDKLQVYLDSALANGKSQSEAYQLLRAGIWIGTKCQVDEVWTFSKVERLYLSKEYEPEFCMESLLEEGVGTDMLVSPDYLAKKHKDPDAEATSWRQFFSTLGVRLTPAVEPVESDWKCSDELKLLLDSSSSKVRKATLECMSQHWSDYADKMSYRAKVGRSMHDTKFALSLRASQAPSRKRSMVQLSDAYYPTTELRSLLGKSLPYLDAVLSTEMLDACRVTHKLDAKALVKRLNQFKTEDGATPKQVQGIYRALEDRLWDAEAAYIKQAFNGDRLIFVKGINKGWFKPSEVAWQSNGTFLDSMYPPLHSQYRDFSKFFCNKLGISKELPTEKFVDALMRLDEIVSPDERIAEALTIYKRVNRDLGPRFGREQQLPDWIKTFQTDAVFINQRGELVPSDEYLFANDSSWITALFKDDEDLSILAVSPSEVPRLGRVLDAAEVQRLSNSITLEVSNTDSGVLDDALTARVRCSVHFFARVLYGKRPDVFEQALKDGKFASLREFEVVEVPQVDLVVSLGENSRETTIEMALSGGRVLYRTGAKLVKDLLAEELSKFLGASGDHADTFARILMENDAGSIEDLLEMKGIGILPADLHDALDHSPGVDIDDEVPDTTSAEAEGNEVDGPVEEDGPASVTEVEKAPPQSSSIAPSHPVGGGVSQAGAHTRDNPILNAGIKQPAEPGASPRELRNGNVGQSAPKTAAEPPSGALTGAQFGSRTSQMSKGSTHADGRSERGQSQPSRTRAGRLLSYAAGPGDADKRNLDDDPAKAAAREATGRAAVEYFMKTQAGKWKFLTEMPHNNPGFDVLAITDDDQEEFIEIKGQTAAWTEEGVALTPTELMTAQQKGERYWLCVVEHAHDDKRRQLYLLRNPFGLTNQFRFDLGWKSAAEDVAMVPLKPEKDMYIDMKDVGAGKILSVRQKGRFCTLHVILKDGRQVNKLFNPKKMSLSKE